MRPEKAVAANGNTVTVGGLHTGTLPTVLWHTASGNLGPVSAQALLAGVNSGDSVEYGVDGEVSAVSLGTGVGVRGLAGTPLQTGVVAQNTATGGTALKVTGLACFSRSGRSSISKGSSSRTVSGLSNISTTSMILVTLQGDPGSGIYLRYAVRLGSTSFRVNLTAHAKKTVAFAWLILD